MTDKPILTEQHFRGGSVLIPWHKVKAMVINEALRRLDDVSRVTAAIKTVERTEGSPSYKIEGFDVRVTLVEDLMPIDDPKEPGK